MQDVNTLFFNNSKEPDAFEDGALDMELRIKTIATFARLTNATCFVIDFDEHRMLYQTEKMLFLNEVSLYDFQRQCENPYWGLVREDTLKHLLHLRNNYPLSGKTMDAEDYKTHVCTIDYPIVVKKKEFYVNQKFTPLLMRSDGITKIGLFLVGPSTCNHLESFIIAESGKRWRFDFNVGQYEKFDLSKALSLTEKVILTRVQKGLTIEEIAEDLNLSVPTIKTHRTRIFKKLKVKSMGEALTVISNYNLI